MAKKSLNFSVGMDDSDMTSAYQRMQAGANQTATVISTKMRNAQAQMNATRNSISLNQGGGFHPGARVAGDAINALTGGRGAVMELRALEGLTGASLGVAAAAVIAYKSYEHFSEAIGKVREESENAAKAFGHMNATIVAAGPDAVSKQISTLEENSKKLEASRTMSAEIANQVKMAAVWSLNTGLDRFGMHMDNPNAMNKSRALQTESDKQALALRTESIAQIKDETAEKENQLSLSSRQYRLQQAHRDLLKNQAEIELKYPGGIAPALKDQAQVDYENRKKVVEHEEDSKDRQLSLERQIADIKKSGLAPLLKEEQIANAKINAAKGEEEFALNPDERAAALAKAASLEGDRDEAQSQRIRKLKEETKEIKNQADKQAEMMENDRVREEFQKRAQLGEKQENKSKQEQLQSAEKLSNEINKQVSAMETQGQSALNAAMNDPHHAAVNMRRAAAAAAKAQRTADRATGISAKDRANIADVQKLVNGAAKKIEATIAQGDIDKLLAGIKLLIVQ